MAAFDKKDFPEFRKDLVSGDWILVAPVKRENRPQLFKDGNNSENKREGKSDRLKECPFENPQKNGNPFPILWYPKPAAALNKKNDFSSWFLQVIPNKYPLLNLPLAKECPKPESLGHQKTLKGVGFHEVIITRGHSATIDKMTVDEVKLIIKAYQSRYQALSGEPCVNYILILHNQGKAAGASIPHPHSQLIALPVIDPDISKSLIGSRRYYEQHKKCIHCAMLEWELARKSRIVYINKNFVTLVPFAPRASYETRIYPLAHSANFEKISEDQIKSFAESLIDALKRINRALKGCDYNFFIHTVPLSARDSQHYHWHMEILPRVASWAGLELGMGIEVVAVSPEEAAEKLRKSVGFKKQT